jgi:pimeloyl-ACP methyl ester carboxylesterase
MKRGNFVRFDAIVFGDLMIRESSRFGRKVLLLAGLALGCAGPGVPAFQEPGPLPLFEKPTRVVPTAYGSRLAVYCAGSGQRTVVLESGVGGGSAESWSSVLPLVARRARVCAYDRAGFGFSRLGGDLPRDLDRDLAGLRAVIHDVAPRGGVVLVGHSMGGTIAAAYADRFPADVAGLVLIEPAVVLPSPAAGSSDTLDTAQQARFKRQLDRFAQCAARFTSAPAPTQPSATDSCINSRDFVDLSPSFTRLEVQHRSTPDYWRAFASEMESNWFGVISRQAAALLPHQWHSLPVRVVTAAVSEMSDSSLSAALGLAKTDSAAVSPVRENHRNWEQRQAQLCSFSTDCIVTKVRTANHFVQIAEPEIVAALVNELVARSR